MPEIPTEHTQDAKHADHRADHHHRHHHHRHHHHHQTQSLDDELKHEVAHWAAFYEHRMVTGSKEIFHLEAFVAKFMSIYKQFLINMFG